MIAPGIDFAQRSSMQPESLAEAAEALGMRVQLSDGDEVVAQPRSRLGQYTHSDHAWTPE